MPWKPSEEGEVPTLGWYVIDWIRENLAAPDKAEYEPFILYQEQEDFILRFYEIDPETCTRRYRRGVLSRPRGWGKSPLLGAMCIVEGLADVVPDGWDADGQPIGRPWSTLKTPLIQIGAVAEVQTRNTYKPLRDMLTGPVSDNYPGIEVYDAKVVLPRGEIMPVTTAARTIKGNTPVLMVLDQSEEMVQSNGGKKFAETALINAAKYGGYLIESPNAFTPGEDSVAEASFQYWQAIQEGNARDEGMFYDHREAPADTDLRDAESIMVGLRVAYGDSSNHPDGCVLHDPPCKPGHSNLKHIAATVWDPSIPMQKSRADFFNQITHAYDSLVSHYDWAGCAKVDKQVMPGDIITLGFDGSRGKAKGKPDATALIGCRVSDKHIFTIGIWEASDTNLKEQANWSPPTGEIESAINEAFTKFRVVGFYADPAKDWRSHVNKWESRYGSKVELRVKHDHPFEYWFSGRTELVQRMVLNFKGVVANKDLSHDGSFRLTKHVLNSRMRLRTNKYTIEKEHDYSDKKIDACVAAMLALQAAQDATAKGVRTESQRRIPRRVR
jgi:hypothetical protein